MSAIPITVPRRNPANATPHDFYETPPEATRALLLHIPKADWIWEPCAGRGAIANILAEAGHNVAVSDIDPAMIGAQYDFLSDIDLPTSTKGLAIVTNPPYKHAEAFIRKARERGIGFMALLLKSTFWHAASRADLWNTHRPDRILALTWRLDWTGGGAPTMDCAWNVWDNVAVVRAGCCTYNQLHKPAPMESKRVVDIGSVGEDERGGGGTGPV